MGKDIVTTKRHTPWLIKHGASTTPEYNAWRAIKQRCHNPNSRYYKWYGERGIAICERWRDSFQNFLEDMGERPSDKHTLDRIDTDKGYSPDNCRWATRKEQSNNLRKNIPITYQGRTQTISEWADELGFKYFNLYNRICRYGWTVERAFTEPLHWQ